MDGSRATRSSTARVAALVVVGSTPSTASRQNTTPPLGETKFGVNSLQQPYLIIPPSRARTI